MSSFWAKPFVYIVDCRVVLEVGVFSVRRRVVAAWGRETVPLELKLSDP